MRILQDVRLFMVLITRVSQLFVSLDWLALVKCAIYTCPNVLVFTVCSLFGVCDALLKRVVELSPGLIPRVHHA